MKLIKSSDLGLMGHTRYWEVDTECHSLFINSSGMIFAMNKGVEKNHPIIDVWPADQIGVAACSHSLIWENLDWESIRNHEDYNEDIESSRYVVFGSHRMTFSQSYNIYHGTRVVAGQRSADLYFDHIKPVTINIHGLGYKIQQENFHTIHVGGLEYKIMRDQRV